MIRKLSFRLNLDFDAGTLYAEVNENLGRGAGTLLLNRGLKVEKAPVKFSQEIKGLKGIEAFRANVVRLDRPVGKIELSYSGKLEIYEEVFPYLKDSIGQDYTLLRTDSLFYPIPAEPSFESLVKSVVSSEFDAEITIEGIPDDLTVAFGGEIRGRS